MFCVLRPCGTPDYAVSDFTFLLCFLVLKQEESYPLPQWQLESKVT